MAQQWAILFGSALLAAYAFIALFAIHEKSERKSLEEARQAAGIAGKPAAPAQN